MKFSEPSKKESIASTPENFNPFQIVIKITRISLTGFTLDIDSGSEKFLFQLSDQLAINLSYSEVVNLILHKLAEIRKAL